MVLTATEFFSKQPSEKEEQKFWSAIQLPNRTYKTTNEKRLDDLNLAAIGYWNSNQFSPASALDVGVSSGITTLEWLTAMRSAGLTPKVTATDISLNAKIVRPLPFFRVLVRDTPNMEPLQHSLFGWPLNPFFHFGLRSMLGAAATAVLYNPLRLLGMPMPVERTVKMVSPRVSRQEDISFVEDDIFDSQSKARLGKFDVVRAANILNLGYFSATKLELALKNIKRMLNGPGSFFIVVRTLSDGSNHGAMYRLDASDRFNLVTSLGEGSEIDKLVRSN
jgi:SAM-dependent methyltransferase